jgi:hypothetical protein
VQVQLQRSQPYSNCKESSRKVQTPLIERLSEPIYESSIISNASETGLSQETHQRVVRTTKSPGEMQTTKKRSLLERISEHDHHLQFRMEDRPSERLTLPRSHGSYVMASIHHHYRRPSYGRKPSSTTSRVTRSSSRPRSSTPLGFLSSQTRSGPTSSQDAQSTSTMSSRASTQSRTMIDGPRKLVNSRSLSDRLDQPGRLTRTESGSSHGTRPSMRQHMSSRTDRRSSGTMAGIYHSSSPASQILCTRVSSNTTRQCASELRNAETYHSPTTANSLTSTYSGSKTQEQAEPNRGIQIGKTAEVSLVEEVDVERHVGDGMRDGAPTLPPTAISPTSAQSAEAMHTPVPSANSRVPSVDRWALRPRYARDLVWADDIPIHTTLVAWTESAPPLPSPPSNELLNPIALKTIEDHPDLFKIVTPVDVDHLEHLLTAHPNRPLVSSICRGFREGFWPWAITEGVERPLIVDNSTRPLSDEAHINFVHEQRDAEIALERFSPAFGPDLFPGMTSIPIGVVPKPHSDKLRLVVDQSSGDFSPNSLITREHVAVPLDNLHDLGASLINARSVHGDNIPLVVFKSDVSQAYRRLPLHFLWQLFQIITIDSLRHVDRNNNFGNQGAGGLWGAFMGMVLWIAVFVKGIQDLFAYVDDSFSWEFADNMLWYEPYRKHLPAKQAKLLQLWDELHIPHVESKQVFGSTLTIIGFEVDPNAMTITMPDEARTDLLTALRSFAHPGQRRPLRDFQKLAGWMNWALNTCPLLRPGMSSLYDKMSGKVHAHQLIWVSVSLCQELTWFANRLEQSGGIHLMTSREWGKVDADVSLFCDACPIGMGFWFPARNLGFQHAIDPSTPSVGIFYYEALTVVSALHWAVHNIPLREGLHIAIYTDNSNTVDMFNTLRAQLFYNPLVMTAIDLALDFHVEFRVFHIPGEENIVSDAISRFRYDTLAVFAPLLHLLQFQPPRLTLGAEPS